VLGFGLFARERQRIVALVAWAAAALNPLVNLVAIPLAVHFWSNGAIGAAAVTVATECFMGIWIWKTVGADVDRRQLIGVIARSLLACGVMCLAVRVVVPVTGPLASVPVAALVYAAMVFQLRLVSFGELRRLQSAFGSRVAPAPAD
jgi:O-antigen/teichoic acid export membrane protein